MLVVGLMVDTRRGSPEPTVRQYLADLEAHRVEQALAALDPREALRWRDFLEFQQFNRYQVVSVAIRSPSLLESLTTGQPWRPTQLTLVADSAEPSGLTWRGSTLVPVSYVDGHWRLDRPPFAPS